MYQDPPETSNNTSTITIPNLSASGGGVDGFSRSPAYDAIINEVPSAVVILGGLALMLAFGILILIAAIVPYPQTITAPGKLNSQTLPTSALARRGGELSQVLVEDGIVVEAGAQLAVVANHVDLDEFRLVADWMNIAKREWFEAEKLTPTPSRPIRLGPLQKAFADVVLTQQEFRLAQRNEPGKAQLSAILAEIEVLSARIEHLNATIEHERISVSRARERVRDVSEDLKKGWTTLRHLDEVENTLFTRERALSESESARKLALAESVRLLGSSQRLKAVHADRITRHSMSYTSALNSLEAEIADWQYEHVITSPSSGVVRYTSDWDKGQHIETGHTFAVIEPSAPRPIVTALFFSDRISKVKVGSPVYISLRSYDALEVGKVHGNVEAISAITDAGKRRLTIYLPNGLRTNTGRNLRFSQGGPVTVEVVTEPNSVLTTVFRTLVAAFRV